ARGREAALGELPGRAEALRSMPARGAGLVRPDLQSAVQAPATHARRPWRRIVQPTRGLGAMTSGTQLPLDLPGIPVPVLSRGSGARRPGRAERRSLSQAAASAPIFAGLVDSAGGLLRDLEARTRDDEVAVAWILTT